IDLATARRQLSSSLSEIHVIAVKGECKEVLFVCQQAHGNDAVEIHCINIDEPRNPEQAMAQTFRFTQEEESDAVPVFCQSVKQYIYEPHAALMKAGPFGLMCQKYHVEKLDRNTHLYTSADLIAEFPGRIFEVINPILLNSKSTHAAIPDGKAHVVCRNYPVDAEALQRQLKLKEGGRLFVLATTIATRKTGLLCRRVE
ncbi:MAG: hypothetical protein IJ764_08130, partial [Bacteroidales bacterium]|nr:hypothetical protein [Bacteroidales bacterium]